MAELETQGWESRVDASASGESPASLSFLQGCLSSHAYLKNAMTLETLAGRAKACNLSAGEVVVMEGRRGDRLLLAVESGECEVVGQLRRADSAGSILMPGIVWGDEAFVFNVSAKPTSTALSSTGLIPPALLTQISTGAPVPEILQALFLTVFLASLQVESTRTVRAITNARVWILADELQG
jgi:hypothetical protein